MEETTEGTLDISNRQMVSVRGEKIVILLPRRTMTKEEALIHAAWLVAMVGDEFGPNEWNYLLELVRNA